MESQKKLIAGVVADSISSILKSTAVDSSVPMPQENSDLRKTVKFLDASKIKRDNPKKFFAALKALKDNPQHSEIIMSLPSDEDKELYVRYVILNEEDN